MRFPGARALLLGALLVGAPAPATSQVPTPATHFGFPLGTDRRLATAEAIEQYFTLVSTQSDRVKSNQKRISAIMGRTLEELRKL